MFFLLHFVYTALAANNQCYFPNGKVSADDYPCSSDADSSACCGGGLGTICLSNNLCQGPDGAIIRGSCSDKNWDSDSCAHYCMSASLGGTDLVSCANVTQDDTSYCCNGVENCCDSGDGRFSVGPSNPTKVATWNAASTKFVAVSVATDSSSASTSSTSTLSTRSTSTISTSPTSTVADGSDTAAANPLGDTNTASQSSGTSSSPTAQPSSDLSSGAKAGIGIGAAVGAVLIAALTYTIWRLQKMSKMLGKNQVGEQPQYAAPQGVITWNEVNALPKHEPEVTEIYTPDRSRLHELPSGSA